MNLLLTERSSLYREVVQNAYKYPLNIGVTELLAIGTKNTG